MRQITINLNHAENKTREGVAGSILFELLNAQEEKRLDAVLNKKGISRIDYIAGIEYIEYENTQKYREFVSKGRGNGWAKDMPLYFKECSFSDSIIDEAKISDGKHLKVYGDYWNAKYLDDWVAAKMDPNNIVELTTKKLNEAAIKALKSLYTD